MTPDTAPSLRRSRDIGDILNLSFQLLRRDYRLLARAVLLYVLPFAVISAIGQVIYLYNWIGMMPDAENIDSIPWAMLGLGYGLILLGGGLAMCAASSVIFSYLYLYDELHGGAIDSENLHAGTRQYIARMIGYWALIIPIGLVAIAVAIIPCLGIIAVGIAAFYAYPRFFIGSTALVIEDLRPTDAFRRGFSLVTDHYWPTFGIIFIAGIIAGILGGIFSVPSFILMGVNTVMRESGNPPGLIMNGVTLSVAVLSSLVSSLFYAYMYLPIGLQYYNLVERKEHAGLMARVRTLEGTPSSESSPLA